MALAHFVRETFAEVLGQHVNDTELHQVYDIAHNMAKLEEHEVDGRKRELCVHRKGATRAFGPGSPELPPDLREIGQPVLIPGSMGTASLPDASKRSRRTRSRGMPAASNVFSTSDMNGPGPQR